jgi:hypothetical protein
MDLIRPARSSKDSNAGARATASSLEERGFAGRAGAEDCRRSRRTPLPKRTCSPRWDDAQSLLHANDLNELMRVHGENDRSRMRSLTEQAGEMDQIVSRAAMAPARPRI